MKKRTRNKKHNRRLAILCLVVSMCMGAAVLFSGNEPNSLPSEEGSEQGKIPSSAQYWDNFTFIHINGNWSDATDLGWCKGDGSFSDPYTLENMTINAADSPTGFGIHIEGKNSYFKLNNITITNALEAGIFLDFTENATITECNLTNNNNGIKLVSVNNTIIEKNVFINNTERGIWYFEDLKPSVNNSALYNNISLSRVGIESYGYPSSFFNISHNRIINCSEDGIELIDASNCNIHNNYIEGCGEESIFISGFMVNNNLSSNEMKGAGLRVIAPLSELKTHNVDESNKVNGGNVYFYVEKMDLTANNFSNAGQVILHYCQDVKLENQDFSDTYRPVEVKNSQNVSISLCNFSNVREYGIEFGSSKRGHFTNNTITGNLKYAIYLNRADNCTLRNNSITTNLVEGLRMIRCENATISENKFYGCGIFFSGSKDAEFNHSIDITNLVNNKPLYYYKYAEDLDEADFSNAGQIILYNVNDTRISDASISNTTYGIITYYCHNISIAKSELKYCTSGIYISENGNHTITSNSINYTQRAIDIQPNYLKLRKPLIITNNTITNNFEQAISVANSDDSNISLNIIYSNGGFGIFLENSHFSHISNNTILNTSNSLRFEYCDFNNISDNNVNFTLEYAVYLIGDSNSVYENEFINNSYGIMVDSSENNTIHNNYFENSSQYFIELRTGADNTSIYLNNFIAGRDSYAIDEGLDNIWHNGTHGNYWDDYSGKDTDDDGIGESPYTNIDGGSSIDPYPLWWDAPVFTILPANNTLFNKTSPFITLTMDEGLIDTYWYNIDGDLTEYNFTGPTGRVNQTAWSGAGNGTILIHFYGNDSRNYITERYLTVKRDALGPLIDILAPEQNEEYGELAPTSGNFSLNIRDGNGIDVQWYMLYNDSVETQNTTWAGQIDQAVWEQIGEGSLTLRIYANDSLGNLNFTELILVKSLPSSSEEKETEDEEDKKDDSGPTSDPISFLTSPTGIAVIGIIAGGAILVIFLAKRGKGYKSTDKERKKIEDVISE